MDAYVVIMYGSSVPLNAFKTHESAMEYIFYLIEDEPACADNTPNDFGVYPLTVHQ